MRHPYTHNTLIEQKTIADSLSRYFHRSDLTLTNKFNQILPQQTAALFHIKQPPINVISWISLISSASTLPKVLPKPLRPISLATGIGGTHSPNTQEPQTNSWGVPHKSREQSLCHHSPPQCNETSSAQPRKKYSSMELSSPPYRMYLRPSILTFVATQT